MRPRSICGTVQQRIKVSSVEKATFHNGKAERAVAACPALPARLPVQVAPSAELHAHLVRAGSGAPGNAVTDSRTLGWCRQNTVRRRP